MKHAITHLAAVAALALALTPTLADTSSVQSAAFTTSFTGNVPMLQIAADSPLTGGWLQPALVNGADSTDFVSLSTAGLSLNADSIKQGSLPPRAISAIPEPGIYALMLGGLGVMGFVVRRRSGR